MDKPGTRTRVKEARGRTSSALLLTLREELLSGQYLPGQFIPAQRELAKRFQVSLDTVRRALKALQQEKLLDARARQGFCVQPKTNDPLAGCPLAFLDWNTGPVDNWGNFDRDVLAALRTAAGARSWPILALSLGNQEPQRVSEQLLRSRAFGAILCTPDEDTVRTFRQLKIPAMMLDQWVVDAGIDSVMQDGLQGGILAARDLLARGCRRIAWFGPIGREAHSLSRLGGVTATLMAAGRPLTPELTFASHHTQERLSGARAVFAGRHRPDGIVALWQRDALSVKQAADEKGLVAGRDFHLVGWSPDEWYDGSYATGFAGSGVPPTITWSIRTMAETAIARMAERRETPSLPALQIKIPVRLRTA